VTGEAARALNSSGQFVLPLPTAVVEGREISEQQAVALATSLLRIFGPSGLTMYERDRGAKINLAALEPCSRAYYADTPYEPLAEGVFFPLRKLLGSWWLVSMCAPGEVPTISIAVSALATDVSLEPTQFAVQAGNGTFVPYGIPVKVVGAPIPPEMAVQLAAEATGKRVSRVPELVLPPYPWSPQAARWRIVLDAPVTLRGTRSGQVRTTTELFVGHGQGWPTILLEAPNPAAQPQPALEDQSSGSPVQIPLQIRPGYPAAYEPITVVAR
jgi:hypothetical protein